ncbi:MAG: hypothetical protein WBH20_06590 [Oceanisphaera sp.]|uniref:hypothetical protein n=1 Tax=Oceanisphaera sp. TaxID=1929979 RepID=UPI003C72533F
MTVEVCCKLCKSSGELKKSHIIPKFLYRYLYRYIQKIESGNKPIQFNSELNLLQRSDRQWKEYMFCGECEELLSKNETKFSKIFHDIVSAKSDDRVRFSYSQNIDIDVNELNKSIGLSAEEIDNFLSGYYFDSEKADVVRYFAISYVIRTIYLSREYVEISDNLISQLESMLYGNNLSSAKVVMTVNTGKDYKAVFSAFCLDSDKRFKHFVFILPEIKMHLILDEELKYDASELLVLPSDLYKEDDIVQLVRSISKNVRRSDNLKI